MSRRPSLAQLLDAVDAALSPALVPAAPRGRLRALCARLPFIPCLGLECHLGAAAPRTDLLTYTNDLDLLRGLPGGWPLAPPTPSSRALLDRWIDAFVLEFDVTGSRAERPSLFLNIKPGARVGADALVALAGCLDADVSDGAERCLRRAAAAAVSGLSIVHLGAMRSRTGGPLRVNVGARTAAALVRFASKMAWPSDQCAAIAALTETVRPFAHHVVLAFDAGPAPPSRVGLECYLAPTSARRDDWRRLLAQLAADGLCTPEQSAALLEWRRSASDADGLTMRGQARLSRFLGPGYAAAIARTLNHVTLVAARGQPLRAKAYLLARREWRERA